MSSIRTHLPNALSVLRLLLTGALAVLLFIPAHPLWLAQILFVGALVSDKLDGSLARWWNTVSELGKKLESLVDPAFGFITTIYCVVVLDFPWYPFVVGLVYFGLVVIIRAVVSARVGSLFYEKSPLTRYGVGLLYVILFFYIFQFPYRELLVWLGIGYGTIATINYIRMMILFARRSSTHSR
jgi:phosphatidylglycerophosphate synthase